MSVKLVSRKIRGKSLALLKQSHQRGELALKGSLAEYSSQAAFQPLALATVWQGAGGLRQATLEWTAKRLEVSAQQSCGVAQRFTCGTDASDHYDLLARRGSVISWRFGVGFLFQRVRSFPTKEVAPALLQSYDIPSCQVARRIGLLIDNVNELAAV